MQWSAKLTEFLMQCGYTLSKVDYSLIRKSVPAGFTVVLIYFDDFVLAGNDLTEIESLKHKLYRQFSIRDLGKLKKYFLVLKLPDL